MGEQVVKLSNMELPILVVGIVMMGLQGMNAQDFCHTVYSLQTTVGL